MNKHELVLAIAEGIADRLIENNREITNGEVIKALFPQIEVKPYGLITRVKGLDFTEGALDPYRSFWTDWWNAPYKAESEDKE